VGRDLHPGRAKDFATPLGTFVIANGEGPVKWFATFGVIKITDKLLSYIAKRYKQSY
jgi:hypothetical protein